MTHTLAELQAAQAAGKRVEMFFNGRWAVAGTGQPPFLFIRSLDQYRIVEDTPVSEPKRQPHKHAALIKAWADGVEIEFLTKDDSFTGETGGKWKATGQGTPLWTPSTQYRIKPEPKPDVITYAAVCGIEAWRKPAPLTTSPHNWNNGKGPSYTNKANVEFTFDGETGKLKKVEMV